MAEPDHLADVLNYGDDENPPPLTQPDVERWADDQIGIRFGTVEYIVPEGTARDWHRLFRDFLDGRHQGAKGLPDIEYMENYYPNQTDVYTISIGGTHTEQGDGWHIQSATLDRALLADLVDMLDDVLDDTG